MTADEMIPEGSQWIATWAKKHPTQVVWTVRGVTKNGVFFTAPEMRCNGHLLSVQDFLAEYDRKDS